MRGGLGSLGRGGIGKRPSRHYGLRKGNQRVEAPPAGPTGGHLVVSYTIPTTDNRNDFTGEVGVRINMTAVETYTWIGLLVHPGNTGTHVVNLREWFTDTIVATASFDLTGKTAGDWLWQAISPITVAIGSYYALLEVVTALDGQFWYNNAPTTFDPTRTGNIYATYRPPGGPFGVTSIDQQFVGVDLGWDGVVTPPSGVKDYFDANYWKSRYFGSRHYN